MVEANNIVKGPVFLDIDLSQNLVMSAGEFTTQRFEEFGEQEIGQIQTSHNIIDDNMVGFRIIEAGKTKKVEKLNNDQVSEIVKLLEKIDKKANMPIKRSEINLIEKQTGYKLVIKDKSLIIEDSKER